MIKLDSFIPTLFSRRPPASPDAAPPSSQPGKPTSPAAWTAKVGAAARAAAQAQAEPKTGGPLGDWTPDSTLREPADNNQRLAFFDAAAKRFDEGPVADTAGWRAAWEKNFTGGGVDTANGTRWKPLSTSITGQRFAPKEASTLLSNLDVLEPTFKPRIPTPAAPLMLETAADGKWQIDAGTIGRLMQFQASAGLPVTGLADEKTVAKLGDKAQTFQHNLETLREASAKREPLYRQLRAAGVDFEGIDTRLDEADNARIEVSVRSRHRDEPWVRSIPQSIEGVPVDLQFLQ